MSTQHLTSISDMLKLKLIMGAQTGEFNITHTLAHVYQMLSIYTIELCFNQIPLLFSKCRRPNKQAVIDTPVLTINQEKFISSISFSHTYNTTDSAINIVDKIMWYITKLEHIPHLTVIIQEYFINDETIIHIEDDIYFQLKRIHRADDGKIDQLDFVLYAKQNPAIYLRSFVDKCVNHYEIFQNNKFGDQLYYFDLLSTDPNKNNVMNLFQNQQFNSFRTFDNIFFDNQQTIMKRIDTFINNIDWYKHIGKPHTLGFLLYGSPGCGKTSFIKALAVKTNRHIVNIKLDEIRTNQRFKQLFFDETIMLRNDNPHDMNPIKECKIPINQRIYVLEDIDCDDNAVVFKREYIEKEESVEQSDQDIYEYNPEVGSKKKKHNDKLNLATILNVLDGILEIPGRILIATSNHPEKIDEAFLRPGRFDYTIEFTRATDIHIRSAIHRFSKGTYEIDPQITFESFKWTMAEIMQILWFNGDGDENISKSISIINDKNPSCEFKFR